MPVGPVPCGVYPLTKWKTNKTTKKAFQKSFESLPVVVVFVLAAESVSFRTPIQGAYTQFVLPWLRGIQLDTSPIPNARDQVTSAWMLSLVKVLG